ncbi:MAG: anaerobic ribonucleoside-triphosphate reductase activating protein [Candidatus Margulisbacteria bacterium GWF2_38_17]|nr:MAG: anaerobic ribonucleoside-triphosphate reductase activating protein [Candidatus Margulisbacteria bacterium GWF2_38_17]
MSIGGYIKTSFVDYPGKIATTIFLSRCNFRCPYCQNPELVLDSAAFPVDFKEIIEYLKKSQHLIDAVCFSGGEPTIDPQLSEYIAQVKGLGFLIKLDTNGSDPEILQSLPINYLALDIKTIPEKYTALTTIPEIGSKITRTINYLINEASFEYEFRTTLVPGLVDENDMHTIGKLIQGTKKWFLQQFRNTSTLDPSYKTVQPFSTKEIQKLVEIAKQYVPGTFSR